MIDLLVGRLKEKTADLACHSAEGAGHDIIRDHPRESSHNIYFPVCSSLK